MSGESMIKNKTCCFKVTLLILHIVYVQNKPGKYGDLAKAI